MKEHMETRRTTQRSQRSQRRKLKMVFSVIFAISVFNAVSVFSQAPSAPLTAKSAAPIDITGYWVAVITEDWRGWRRRGRWWWRRARWTWPWPRRAAGRRLALRDDDEFPRGLSAQERRAVQREREHHRVLRQGGPRTERRRHSPGAHGRRRSKV